MLEQQLLARRGHGGDESQPSHSSLSDSRRVRRRLALRAPRDSVQYYYEKKEGRPYRASKLSCLMG